MGLKVERGLEIDREKVKLVQTSVEGIPPRSFEAADLSWCSPCRHDAVCTELLMDQKARESSSTARTSKAADLATR